MNARIIEKIATAAAKRLGFTAAQADAWPVPLHDIGMQAARAAGYVGGDHPAGY